MPPPSIPPPELSGHVGPVLAPIVAVLWAVIGWPVYQLAVLMWFGLEMQAATMKVGPALAEVTVGLVVMGTLAGAVLMAVGVLLLAILTGYCVAWRKG